jgi:hypothetical protein
MKHTQAIKLALVLEYGIFSEVAIEVTKENYNWYINLDNALTDYNQETIKSLKRVVDGEAKHYMWNPFDGDLFGMDSISKVCANPFELINMVFLDINTILS